MPEIGAVVLAAGLSSRMGQFKLLLPWLEGKPIVEHVVSKLIDYPLKHIVVVTGNRVEDIQKALKNFELRFAHNSDFADGEILSSLKVGLQEMPETVDAILVVPGDLPQVPVAVFQAVIAAYDADAIIVPTHGGKNGHPVMFPRRFWQEILELPYHEAPRTVLKANPDKIRKIAVESEGILADIDTLDDYERELKRAQSDSI